jgi:hypothetical protein
MASLKIQLTHRTPTGWTVTGLNPAGGGGCQHFSASIQTGLGAHPASYTTRTGSFPGLKRPGRGVHYEHLAPSLKSRATPPLLLWSYTTTPPLGLRGLLWGQLYTVTYNVSVANNGMASLKFQLTHCTAPKTCFTNIWLQRYFIQPQRNDVCVCVYIPKFYTVRRRRWGKNNLKNWDSSECSLPTKSFGVS